MYYYSDSPARDFAAWDAEQSKWLRSRPVCSECEQHIQDEDFIDKLESGASCPPQG